MHINRTLAGALVGGAFAVVGLASAAPASATTFDAGGGFTIDFAPDSNRPYVEGETVTVTIELTNTNSTAAVPPVVPTSVSQPNGGTVGVYTDLRFFTPYADYTDVTINGQGSAYSARSTDVQAQAGSFPEAEAVFWTFLPTDIFAPGESATMTLELKVVDAPPAYSIERTQNIIAGSAANRDIFLTAASTKADVNAADVATPQELQAGIPVTFAGYQPGETINATAQDVDANGNGNMGGSCCNAVFNNGAPIVADNTGSVTVQLVITAGGPVAPGNHWMIVGGGQTSSLSNIARGHFLTVGDAPEPLTPAVTIESSVTPAALNAGIPLTFAGYQPSEAVTVDVQVLANGVWTSFTTQTATTDPNGAGAMTLRVFNLAEGSDVDGGLQFRVVVAGQTSAASAIAEFATIADTTPVDPVDPVKPNNPVQVVDDIAPIALQLEAPAGEIVNRTPLAETGFEFRDLTGLALVAVVDSLAILGGLAVRHRLREVLVETDELAMAK